MTSTVIEESWRKIFNAFIDVRKDFNLIHTEQIRKFSRKDLRLITKFDSYESQPEIFKKYGYFLLPLQTGGNFVLIRGKGYEKLQFDYRKPKVFISKLGYDLETSRIGISEPQYIDYAFNTGLIESYLNMSGLYLALRGRKRTPEFKFKVGEMDFFAKSVFVEIDAGFENKNNIVLLEAKIGAPASFIIRQIYFPLRALKKWIPSKRITSIFFTFNKENGIYSLYKYKFKDLFRYDSIKLVEKKFYLIKTMPEETLTLDKIAPLGEKVEVISKEIEIPQADDFEKVAKFPFAINEGFNDSSLIAKYFNFTPRQSSYYRHAAESLGLVKLKNNKYFLTDLGKKYINLSTVERNSLLTAQLIKSPIIEIVLNKAYELSPSEVNLSQVAEVIERKTKYNRTTSMRRAKTILSWLKWVDDVLGIFRVKEDKVILKEKE